MTRQLLRLVLSVLCVALLGACAQQASYVTTVGPKKLASAVGECLYGGTVVLVLDDGHGQPSKQVTALGVSVGNGYAVTDAFATIKTTDRVHVLFASEASGVVPAFALPTIVTRDEASGLMLLKIPGTPACDVVLADMSAVSEGEPVYMAVDGYDIVGKVLFPYPEPGRLNAVLHLSAGLQDVPRGGGIYAQNGTLVGLRVGDPDGAEVIALPADRIARFLRAQHVSYMQFNSADRPVD